MELTGTNELGTAFNDAVTMMIADIADMPKVSSAKSSIKHLADAVRVSRKASAARGRLRLFRLFRSRRA